jgi:glycosyltransferase involved in cell wall biosynthesis
MQKIKLLVLSSQRKKCGIADYTKELFNSENLKDKPVKISIEQIGLGSFLKAPFKGAHIIHVQHEFFLFDPAIGFSAIPQYFYLKLFSYLCRYKIVTTIHSPYNLTDMSQTFAHFQNYGFLFPLVKIYLLVHYWLLILCSKRIIVLSRNGCETIKNFAKTIRMEKKVNYLNLGVYKPKINIKEISEVENNSFGLDGNDFVLTLFGFAYKNKGYHLAINALRLLNENSEIPTDLKRSFKLVIISGEASNQSIGGQGDTYLGSLKKKVKEDKLEKQVIFTGFLPYTDKDLAKIIALTRAFVFPYFSRNQASASLASVIGYQKPIIVSNIPYFKEYIQFGGVVPFEEKNSSDLAKKILQVAQNKEGNQKIQSAISQYYLENNMQVIFDRHFKLYQELI